MTNESSDDPLWSVMDLRSPLARKRMEGKPLTDDERAELDRLDALIDKIIEGYEQIVNDLVKRRTTPRELLPRKPLPRR